MSQPVRTVLDFDIDTKKAFSKLEAINIAQAKGAVAAAKNAKLRANAGRIIAANALTTLNIEEKTNKSIFSRIVETKKDMKLNKQVLEMKRKEAEALSSIRREAQEQFNIRRKQYRINIKELEAQEENLDLKKLELAEVKETLDQLKEQRKVYADNGKQLEESIKKQQRSNNGFTTQLVNIQKGFRAIEAKRKVLGVAIKEEIDGLQQQRKEVEKQRDLAKGVIEDYKVQSDYLQSLQDQQKAITEENGKGSYALELEIKSQKELVKILKDKQKANSQIVKESNATIRILKTQMNTRKAENKFLIDKLDLEKQSLEKRSKGALKGFNTTSANVRSLNEQLKENAVNLATTEGLVDSVAEKYSKLGDEVENLELITIGRIAALNKEGKMLDGVEAVLNDQKATVKELNKQIEEGFIAQAKWNGAYSIFSELGQDIKKHWEPVGEQFKELKTTMGNAFQTMKKGAAESAEALVSLSVFGTMKAADKLKSAFSIVSAKSIMENRKNVNEAKLQIRELLKEREGLAARQKQLEDRKTEMQLGLSTKPVKERKKALEEFQKANQELDKDVEDLNKRLAEQNQILSEGQGNMNKSKLAFGAFAAAAVAGLNFIKNSTPQLAAQMTIVNHEFKMIGREIGKELVPMFKMFASGAKALRKAFKDMPDGVKKAIGVFFMLVTAITAIGAVIAFVTPLVIGLGGAFGILGLAKTAKGATGMTKAFLNLGKGLKFFGSLMFGVAKAVVLSFVSMTQAALGFIAANIAIIGPILLVVAAIAGLVLLAKKLPDIMDKWNKSIEENENSTNVMQRAWAKFLKYLKFSFAPLILLAALFRGVGEGVKAMKDEDDGSFGEGFKRGFAPFSDMVTEAKDKFIENFDKIAAFVGTWYQDSVKPQIDKLKQSLITVGTNIGLFDKLDELKQKVMDFMEDPKANIVAWFKSLPKKIGDAIKNLPTTVKDKIDEIIGFFTNMKDDILGAFTGMFDNLKIGDMLGELGSKMITFLADKGIIAQVNKFIDNAVDGVSGFIMDKSWALGGDSAAQEVIDKYIEPIRNLKLSVPSSDSGSGNPPLATGTLEVPQDMDARIHQGEMVIPTTFAEGIRSMLSGQSKGSMSSNITNTFNVYVYESSDADKVAKTVTEQVMAEINRQVNWQ